jgi:hypothetical protein
MTQGSVLLQQRAGKNYPSIVGSILGLKIEEILATKNEYVVAKGSDDLSKVIVVSAAAGVVIGGLGGLIFVENRTGAQLAEAALYLRDKFGTETQLDVETLIATGITVTLEGSGGLSLSKGDSLILRIDGDVSAGNGVVITRILSQLDPNFYQRLDVNKKITQNPYQFKNLKGVWPTTSLLNLINTSPTTDVNITVELHTDEGIVQVIPSSAVPAPGLPLLHGGVAAVPLFANGTTYVHFDVIPADGYLYGAPLNIYPSNGVEEDLAGEDF